MTKACGESRLTCNKGHGSSGCHGAERWHTGHPEDLLGRGRLPCRSWGLLMGQSSLEALGGRLACHTWGHPAILGAGVYGALSGVRKSARCYSNRQSTVWVPADRKHAHGSEKSCQLLPLWSFSTSPVFVHCDIGPVLP